MTAGAEQVAALKQHLTEYRSPYQDLRQPMREIEQELLTTHAGILIANQCVDFQKQDGVTEMEESIMANAVERRLNDLLLRDEADGKLTVNRQPIYVSCVSNFTNFLDLFRKTLRSLEVGVPCVVLSRSNTSQHSYRWTKLLLDLMVERDIDPGLLTFLSCTLEDIVDLTQSCAASTGNLYTTCSRELAKTIKSGYPATVASTGGPNTLVTTELNDQVKAAIQMSASIESSGQCTALRHCVVPPTVSDEELAHVLDRVQEIPEAPKALKEAVFDGVFAKHQGTPAPADYQRHESKDAYFKISDTLPAPGIHEYWRKVVVDFSKLDPTDHQQMDALAAWLNENQPISLAVNGPRATSLKLGLKLFEKTGMVVNTIGSTDDKTMSPALTCQARPQEAEVFGEFPPRATLNDYTRFPVVVPSSNPSYDATYTSDYLKSKQVPATVGKSSKKLLTAIDNAEVRGFCVALIKYLQDVAKMNPKVGFGTSRTAVWGLQRPPLGTTTHLLCSATATWDSLAPVYTIFHSTNAKEQMALSIDPANDGLISFCMANGLPYNAEKAADATKRLQGRSDVFNVVHIDSPMASFPMVGNFVSLYLPLGHIKSTKPNDEEFVLLARLSNKWLNTLF